MIFEKQFWKELFSEFSNDDVTGLAAQLSYFFLLSLFPLLIFLLSLVSFLPVTQEDIFNMLQEYLPPNTQDLIQNNVQQVIDGGGGGLLSFSIIGTIWSMHPSVSMRYCGRLIVPMKSKKHVRLLLQEHFLSASRYWSYF